MVRIRRVLVVDDVDDARDALVRALGSGAVEARGAAEESEAIDVALRFDPDAIVFDLPTADVIDVSTALVAAGSRAKRVALIDPGEPRRDEARQAGVDMFLLRPCTAREILKMLRRLS